jgi:hypothetical protein
VNLASVTIGTAVKNLGDLAFYDCEKLTSLVLPDNFVTIGNSALAYCYGLTNAAIGDSVTNIGDGAFFACFSLADVALPDSLLTIGSYAFSDSGLNSIVIPGAVASIEDTTFANCPYLNAINVDETNSFYSSSDGVLFNKERTVLLCCPGGRTGAYVIPNTVTNIGSYAFYFCVNLTGITIPGNVISIGDYAFNNCQSLITVTIPASVKTIGDQAFAASGLKQIYFRGNAPDFGLDVFAAVGTAPLYYLPGTTGWGATVVYSPMVLWNPQALTGDGRFGVGSNGFGFSIAGTTNIPVVVEGATNLTGAPWTTLQTCTLTNGLVYFSDPQWTNYPSRFYRIRSP